MEHPTRAPPLLPEERRVWPALTAERRQLEARRASAQELAANDRLLKRLRWQLAHAARRAASAEPLTAA